MATIRLVVKTLFRRTLHATTAGLVTILTIGATLTNFHKTQKEKYPCICYFRKSRFTFLMPI